MSDDEIAERIVKQIRNRFVKERSIDSVWLVHYLDESEVYRLAFVADVRERAKARREMKRVRRIVFARLGVADRAAEK